MTRFELVTYRLRIKTLVLIMNGLRWCCVGVASLLRWIYLFGPVKVQFLDFLGAHDFCLFFLEFASAHGDFELSFDGLLFAVAASGDVVGVPPAFCGEAFGVFDGDGGEDFFPGGFYGRSQGWFFCLSHKLTVVELSV